MVETGCLYLFLYFMVLLSLKKTFQFNADNITETTFGDKVVSSAIHYVYSICLCILSGVSNLFAWAWFIVDSSVVKSRCGSSGTTAHKLQLYPSKDYQPCRCIFILIEFAFFSLYIYIWRVYICMGVNLGIICIKLYRWWLVIINLSASQIIN